MEPNTKVILASMNLWKCAKQTASSNHLPDRAYSANQRQGRAGDQDHTGDVARKDQTVKPHNN